MIDFDFVSPTKIFFGRGKEAKAGEVLRSYGARNVLIVYGSDDSEKAVKSAEALRNRGIRTDIYLQPDAKMKKIYSYAEMKAIPYMLTLSPTLQLKDLRTRETKEGETIEEIAEGIRLG